MRRQSLAESRRLCAKKLSQIEMLQLPVNRRAFDAGVFQEGKCIGHVKTGLQRAVTHHQSVVVTCLPGISFTDVWFAGIWFAGIFVEQ